MSNPSIQSHCLFLILVSAGLAACSGGGESSSASASGGDGSADGISADQSTSSSDGTGGGGSGSGVSGSGGSSAADGSTSGSSDADLTGVTTSGPDPLALCGGTCQCNNGIDDDGDGKVDGFDEECTGSADDDEGTFATGIPGDNKDPKWQDCFFDGNSGAGDDGCRYHTDCLTGDLPEDDPACSVTQSCIDFCAPRTPNGCDCFGCCTFETPSGSVSVLIGSSCDYDNIDDTGACPRCTPSTACGNDCGECELCPGKDVLPETCTDQVPECDGGLQACDADTPCPGGYWCQLGCCIIQAIE